MTGLFGTITLASNPLPVFFRQPPNTVTFAGSGVSDLTVSGANLYQVFLIPMVRSSDLSDFTVANGCLRQRRDRRLRLRPGVTARAFINTHHRPADPEQHGHFQ